MAQTSRSKLSDEQLGEIIESDDFWNDIETSDTEEIDAVANDQLDTLQQIVDAGDQSDADEEDDEIFSEHDSDSDLEWHPTDDEEEVQLDEADSNRAKNYWYGKDNTKEAPGRTRTLSHNIVTVLPGLKNDIYKNPPRSPLDAWEILFSNEILELIVQHKNTKIDDMQRKYKKFKTRKNSSKKYSPTFIHNTDLIEIKAFIGLLYMQGVFKSSHEDLRSLWATDGTGREIFRCTMSMARFSFLLCALRFDDHTTRSTRVKNNPLAAFSDIFDIFFRNCKQAYSPGVNVTVDEMLVAFRGRCRFRMYMPNKPAKYGIKIQILADTKTHFAVNAEDYTGKNPTEDRTRFTHPTHVVLRLVEPIVNTNRNITGDNWYTSVELADALRSKGLTYVGTMKKNKRAIPPQFLPNRTRQTDSSLFGFTAQNTIVSYVPRRGKSVVLLSTMHHNASVDGSTKKPEIILYYNGTKGGVDALDEKCARYSTSRRTRRWPMVLFHAILDIAGVNARILYQFAQAGEFISRSSYLKELGRQLYTPYVTARISNQNVPRKIRMKAADILKLHLEESSIPLEMPQRSKRPRCRICPPNKDRKTSNVCSACKIPVCLQCSKIICINCAPN
nr:unnamed protein product [Callosobruchus chinensis]